MLAINANLIQKRQATIIYLSKLLSKDNSENSDNKFPKYIK